MRSNYQNDGRGLENLILRVAENYREQGIMRLEKVTPPTRTMTKAGRTFSVFLTNPFPDFIGAWTEHGGRTLAIESKSTSYPQLPLGDGGITTKQRELLISWHEAGAAVGVIWEFRGRGFSFVPIGRIQQNWNRGIKHVKWDDCEILAQGQGFALIDFVQNLRHWYPKLPTPPAP